MEKVLLGKISQLSQLILINKYHIYSVTCFKECIYFPPSVLDLKFMVQDSSICRLDVYLISCS